MHPGFAQWLAIGDAYGVAGDVGASLGARMPQAMPYHGRSLPYQLGAPGGTPFGSNWDGPDCPPSDPLCSSGQYGGDVSYPQGVSGLGGVAAIPMGEIQQVDAAVRQYENDVSAWKQKQPNAADPKVAPFWMSWDTFRITWAADLATLGAGNAPFGAPAGLYGDENVASYQRKVASFNELVRQGKAAGVVSTVATIDTRAPLEKTGATIAAWAPWLAGVAALLALAWIAGPVVAALVARKSVGLP